MKSLKSETFTVKEKNNFERQAAFLSLGLRPVVL